MRLFEKREDDAPGEGIDSGRVDVAASAIVCAGCRSPLTSPASRIEVAGSRVHVFMNPGGLVFEIECFREAPGARSVGLASAEWSWFPGRLWTVALCSSCRAHVGWRFESRGVDDPFHGLIRDRIAESG